MKKLFGKNQIMIASLALMIALAGYFNFAGRGDSEGVTEETVLTEDVASAEDTELYDISMEDIASLDEEYSEADDEYLSMSEMDTEGLNAFIAESVDSESVEGVAEAEESEAVADAQESEAVAAEEVSAEAEPEINEIPGEAVFTSSAAINNLADARLAKEQIRAKNREMLQEMMDNTNLSEEQKSQAVNSMIALTDAAEKEMSAEILLESKGFSNAVVSITGDTADVCVASESLSDAQCAQIIDIVQRKTGISPEKIVITPVSA